MEDYYFMDWNIEKGYSSEQFPTLSFAHQIKVSFLCHFTFIYILYGRSMAPTITRSNTVRYQHREKHLFFFRNQQCVQKLEISERKIWGALVLQRFRIPSILDITYLGLYLHCSLVTGMKRKQTPACQVWERKLFAKIGLLGVHMSMTVIN